MKVPSRFKRNSEKKLIGFRVQLIFVLIIKKILCPYMLYSYKMNIQYCCYEGSNHFFMFNFEKLMCINF